ncbi:MAG: NAD-dependent epimerase/dehydratase family protein [Nitriliruptorales bacterium]|nr:NAD-dependent epimerase/dehydratase family protein [Nitriliruptorales bacterium]
MTDPATMLITGANGFVGTALRSRLRDRGITVRGVDLQPGPGVVRGDTTDPSGWSEQLDGVDVVVHTAAIVTFAGDEERFWRTNVLGTRRVLEAAAAADVRRAVVISSVVVYGFDIDGVVDEAWPVRPNGSPYVDTKVATEQVALQAHAAGEIDVVVIRPGDVYGPASPAWTLSPISELRRGRAAVPSGDGVLNLIYIDDLVAALDRAVTVPEAAGQVLNVTGGEVVSPLRFFSHYARMLGTSPPRSLPAAVLRPAAAGLRRVDELRGHDTDLSAFAIDYLTRPARISNARARRVLGWEPQVSLDEGMRRTESWLHETGII